MVASLERLLTGIIDYAGLFPPAKLPMEEHFSHYLTYRGGAERWLVNRLICPASQLGSLADQIEASRDPHPIAVSVVGTGASSHKEWERSLATDAEQMNAFIARVGSRGSIEAFEAKIPHNNEIYACLNELQNLNEAEVYVELGWDDAQEEAIAAVAESEWGRAKGRTGGIQPTAFPSSRQVAKFLQACAQLDVPFKLTAGLHHPFRHENTKLGVKEHGFLNVLTALALHLEHDLNTREMATILEDENPAAFRFDATGLAWGESHAGLETLAETRELFLGYGSCSVEEPLEDLTRLGYLEKTNA